MFIALFSPAIALATVEDEAVQAVDLFYDLRFDQAIQATQEMKTRYPESPAGDFYLSVAYYQKSLVEDPPNPHTFEQFMAASSQAFEKATKLAKTSPSISDYYQGAVLGFQARVYVAQRHFGAAVPKAREAVYHLKRALDKDPTLIDANLGLGLYYYFLSRFPSAAKPFAYMMVGMWGNRDKGLKLINEVSQNGTAARSEAQSVLAAIDASQKEQKWDEAILLFENLMQHYPHNPRYRLSLIYVFERKGLWIRAAEMTDVSGGWIQELDPMIRARAEQISRYRLAENLLFMGKTEQAGEILDHLDTASSSEMLRDWLLLRRGNYWDALGKSDKAKPFYEKISEKKAQDLAAIYLKFPFPMGPRDVMPNRWPLANIPAQ